MFTTLMSEVIDYCIYKNTQLCPQVKFENGRKTHLPAKFQKS